MPLFAKSSLCAGSLRILLTYSDYQILNPHMVLLSSNAFFLNTLFTLLDDELPEYIMVMIANKRKSQQMVDDLSLFLGEETDGFVKW